MESSQSRREILSRVRNGKWDAVVVGGGITGAGILRELTRRGLRVLLVEWRDFAWGTSSRSSKMVHGGLRYLKQGEFGLTCQSVRERQKLIRELPGLVEDREFILPFYSGDTVQRVMMNMGLVVYNLMARSRWRREYSREEVSRLVPRIRQKRLRGGYALHDAVTDDARLVFRLLSEALEEGAEIINYCEAVSPILENGRVIGLSLRDQETGERLDVASRIVFNSTGVWVDRLRGSTGSKNRKAIRPLRGSHLVLKAERIPLTKNLSLFHPKDKRPVMILNWEGAVLVGTTDIDHMDSLDREAAISAEEVRYLLEAVNYQFPRIEIKSEDILSTFSGIRPVINTGKANPSDESRERAIWVEKGLITVTGGKLTTFRPTALEALKAARDTLGPITKIDKRRTLFSNTTNTRAAHVKLRRKDLTRLSGRYGLQAERMIQQSSEEELRKIPGTHTTLAELKWAAQHEFVVHLEDLLLRRTRLGLLIKGGGKELLPRIKEICQPLLNWDDNRWNREERDYLECWRKHYSVPVFAISDLT